MLEFLICNLQVNEQAQEDFFRAMQGAGQNNIWIKYFQV